MTKAELVENMAEDADISKAAANKALPFLRWAIFRLKLVRWDKGSIDSCTASHQGSPGPP